MKKEKTVQRNKLQKTDLDCSVCKKQKECDSRAEGKFCGRFASENYSRYRKGDPLKVWETERKARQTVKKK